MSSSTLVATPLTVIRIGIDPIFHLGPVPIHWYGVMYVVAFLVALRYGVIPHLAARGVPAAQSERMTTWVIVFGLIGARLYYVLQSGLLYYLRNPAHILAVWEGGMAFFGAIIASLLTILVLSRREHVSFWLLADAGAMFAVVGQPIGRIGNVINGDILGGASTLPWATAYTNPHAVLQSGFVLGTPYQPAAVYEALGTLAILAVLVAVRRRGVRPGVLIITYVALYAVSQLGLFFLRASEPVIFLGLKQAQWTALGVLVLGVPMLLALWRRTGGRETPATAERPATPEVVA